MRRKARKRVAGAVRQPIAAPRQANVRWSIHSMADALADGRILGLTTNANRRAPVRTG